MWIAIVVSLFAVMNDFVRPSEGAGFVVILCLCGIVLTCLRLLKSVAKVIVLRRLVQLFLQ